jgi:hypothetical protein
LKLRTETLKVLKKTDKQTSNQFENYCRAEARKNAKKTAEALWEILAIDRDRKVYAESDHENNEDLWKDRNGFVIRFSDKPKYNIPQFACVPLRDRWIASLDALKSHLELIKLDPLRDAWDAGLDEYLAELDPKTAKDIVAVEGAVKKFLRFKGGKPQPELVPEIMAQEREIKAQEKANKKAQEEDNANP